jgi:hypothetical protein
MFSSTMRGALENGPCTQLFHRLEVEIAEDRTCAIASEGRGITFDEKTAVTEYAVGQRGRCLVQHDDVHGAVRRALQAGGEAAERVAIESLARRRGDGDVDVAVNRRSSRSLRSEHERVRDSRIGRGTFRTASSMPPL